MPWFTINDIELNGGDFIYKTKESITRWAYKDERVIKPNTTLICCTASIGEVAFAKVSLITNQQFNAIELFPYIDSINSLWIYIFALTLKPLLKRLMGATTFGFVSVSKVENILMPIPPLNEQTYFQIQEKVKLVETNDKVLNKLKEVIKRKIITLGINGKLLDTDDNYYYQKELKTIELGKALIYEQPTNYIVQSEDYNNIYKTPVLTAGKSFILGKTNETNGIFKASIEPVLIFDDFTTSHHYVDFDFKVKSSAMKILKSSDKENYDVKFFNYLLSSISINANTHKRYWISIFAKLNVEIPSIKFQQKIVKTIETLINKLNLSD